MTTVITVSSIRGGVGKSSLSLELAMYLSLKGKTLIIDADFYSPTLYNEMNARTEKKIDRPTAYFRDFLRGLHPVQESIVKVLPTLDTIFSDPRVNLWELSKDVGTKNFWIEDNPQKASQVEIGMANLREFVRENLYEYIVFDTMGGYGYPVVYLSFISKYPIFLARPSLPQIRDAIGFINLMGKKERPIQLIWSNVPDVENYMESTRIKLESILSEKCPQLYSTLGVIPRDAIFEQRALNGELKMIPGQDPKAPYYEELRKIIEKIMS